MIDPLRHHRPHHPTASPFGGDRFGLLAERFARFFGTPKFIIAQTVVVALWIGLNVVGIIRAWDPYPFILLNLVFSTQAAYAAPLILLAQTRQADRDKATTEADAMHREELSSLQQQMLGENTALTRQIHANTQRIEEVHAHVTALCDHFEIKTGTYEPSAVTE